MASTSDIRKGMCLEHNNDTYMVVEFLHVKPGKGNAFVRTKLKSLTSGKVVDYTFSAGHKINDVRVERRTYQYLYTDGEQLYFMNNETYDQIGLPNEMIEHKQFLKEGDSVEVLFHVTKEIPLTCELPQYVWLTVTYVEPSSRGDTVKNTLMSATVETGAEVRVPLFVKEGDVIKIATSNGAYMERNTNKKK